MKVTTPHARTRPTFNFTGVKPTLIRLVKGFHTPVVEKQLGGKDNVRHTLPEQVVELQCDMLPPEANPQALSVRVSVMSFSKSAKTHVKLAELHEKPFVYNHPDRWISIFDDIVVQFSSHNNGQMLFLQFELLDANKTVVCHIMSHGFETITKRGMVKKKNDFTPTCDNEALRIDQVTPSFGFTCGGTLVKLVGNFTNCVDCEKDCTVKFGDRKAREVFCVKPHCVVCEAPECDTPGDVDIVVNFDNGTCMKSVTPFSYIDTSHPEELQCKLLSSLRV